MSAGEPLSGTVNELSGTVHEENARVFKAFCDPKRLAILDILRGGEQCVCVLMDHLGMGQSAVSYHMKILCDSGVVIGRQEGKWTYYRISQVGARRAASLLLSVTEPYEGEQQAFCQCSA